MNSQEIQNAVYEYCVNRSDFTAPYGVLTGEYANKKGIKYKSVTFGRSRTLDATVEIYNRNFMILRTSSYGSEVYKNFDSLMTKLNSI